MLSANQGGRATSWRMMKVNNAFKDKQMVPRQNHVPNVVLQGSDQDQHPKPTSLFHSPI